MLSDFRASEEEMARRKGSDFGTGLLVFGGLMLLGATLTPSTNERKHSRPTHPTDEQLLKLARSQMQQAAGLLGIIAPPVQLQLGGNAASNGSIVGVNPAFLRQLLATFCDQRRCQLAIVLGIMAHELGHHLLCHVNQLDRSVEAAHARELAADDIAGIVLGLASVPPDDFERVLAYLGQYHSETHPHGAIRVEQVRAAYERTRRA